MEKVINEQVLRHLESNKLIHDREYGVQGDILVNYVNNIVNDADWSNLLIV